MKLRNSKPNSDKPRNSTHQITAAKTFQLLICSRLHNLDPPVRQWGLTHLPRKVRPGLGDGALLTTVIQQPCFLCELFPEGFLPSSGKQLTLLSLPNLPGSLLDRAAVQDKLSQTLPMDTVLEWAEAT